MTAAAAQPTLTPAQYHRNAQLFSDHFLDHILPGRSDWQMLASQARAVRDQLRAILAAYQPSTIEAQTEHDLVRPVLAALGHTFEVQPSLKVPDGSKTPDYVLYKDAAARAGLKGKLLDDALLEGAAFGVAEAKYWDRPLDKALTGPGDAFNNKNPAYQIGFYVQHSGLPWGILTNGRLWRLVHKDSSHKLDRYYEVDLPALLARDELGGDPPDAFLYFYAFFRRAAFDSGEDSPAQRLRLDALLAESADYARNVGEGLKLQVYEALRHIAQGFLDHPSNGLAPTGEDLKRIYDHSLIVLYRLLFVFYAEARELLPLVESPAYRDHYSLRAITRQVARDLAAGAGLLSDSAILWPRLRQLFGIINAGSPPLKVGTFNGGLFDPGRYPFLERHSVGDAHLEAALDCLARVKGQFIDYRDLSERHLGTIYEGLLEHHLCAIAPEGGWTVDLFNDRGERKRTGSYYTPDAIVKYIVEQTVGPALEALKSRIGSGDQQRLVDAVLGLNCLDPAMGSGHFLVEVVETMARFLVDLGAQGGAPDESDLAFWKRRVAQACVYGVDLNPLAVDLAKLSLWLSTAAKDRPLSFLDHHLRAGNSLAGARLAELHELAPTPAERKAARKSAKAAEQAEAAGQISMLEDDAFRQSLSQAVDNMWLIEGIKGNTLDEVKQQEKLYTAMRESLNRRYDAAADLATARRFGLQVDPALAPHLAEAAAGKGVARFPQLDAMLAQVEDLARRHRFFHWELEFPEVFFDKHGYSLGEKAGFDVVVGNPPYVRQETLAPYKPYFAGAFPEVYHGTADLFVYFFAQGMRQLHEDGRLSYIASNSWLRANYATPLRKFLREKTTVETIVDLGDNRVFSEAPDVYPAIIVGRQAKPMEDHCASVAVFARGQASTVELLPIEALKVTRSVQIGDQPDSGWQLGDSGDRGLYSKLSFSKLTLGEVAKGRIYYGVKTGLNEVFVIDDATRRDLIREDPASAQVIKKMVAGEDIRPWYVQHEDRWLIFARRGIAIEKYPAVQAYLQRSRSRLAPRPPDWPSGQAWQGRKPGSYEWFELQDSVDYFRAFSEPKIMWPDIGKFPRFAWDQEGLYLSNTAYALVSGDRWLQAYMASRCAWFLISRSSIGFGKRLGLTRYRLIDQYMRKLPVPNPSASEKMLMAGQAESLTASAHARHVLHTRARHRILTDLGKPGAKLNLKLTAWWELDFTAFRNELKKALGVEIPLKQRDEWEAWLAEKRAEHERLTAEIVRLETELNAQVYGLFDLTPAEIKIIEESTKYKYGEV